MNKTDISVQLYTARKFKPYKDILKFISSKICLLLNDKEIFLSDTFCISFLKVVIRNFFTIAILLSNYFYFIFFIIHTYINITTY